MGVFQILLNKNSVGFYTVLAYKLLFFHIHKISIMPFCISSFFYGRAMLRIAISSEDIEVIQRERYYHPQPHIMMRMHILALHYQGEIAERIAELLGRDRRTVCTCLKTYRDGGLQAVYKYAKHKHKCDLEAYGGLIEKEFEQRPPQSIKEARARITELTGITRGLTQTAEFLKKRFSLLEDRKHSLQSRPCGSERVLGKHYETLDCCRRAG